MTDATPSGSKPSSGNRPPNSGGGQGRGGGQRSGSNRNRSGSNRSGQSNNRNRGGSGSSKSGQRQGQGGSRNGGSRSEGQGSRQRSTETRTEIRVPTALSLGVLATEITPAEILANRHQARNICLIAGLVRGLIVGVIVALITAPLVGLIAFVVVAVLAALAAWYFAPAYTRRRIGGAVVSEDDYPRLANVVEGLCATFGLRPPTLVVVDDPVPNACALGRDPSSAVLVVTSGLLNSMGLIDLEGVVAHELAHIKRHDTVLSQVAVFVSAPLLAFGASDEVLHRRVGRGREYRADEVAAAAVRYPPCLHHALSEMVEDGPTPGPGSIFAPSRIKRTRWLWIDPSIGQRGLAGTEGNLDATAVRIAALAEW